MMLLKERVLVLIERCGAVLFFSCLLVCAPVALGDGGGGKDGAYAEVSQNLDSETEAAGRVLYESRCAQCHDANVVRAPQRYILQLSTPEAILSALNDGLMQQVASDLSLPQKTAIAEFLTKRKMSGDDARSAGLACSQAASEFNRAATPAFSHWGFDQEGTHYIGPDIAKVTKAALPTMEMDWAFAFPSAVRARSQPALAGGAVFVGSQSGLVYAFDAETGCTRWQFMASAEVRNAMIVAPWDPADEKVDPLVYFGDVSGNQYAVSAITGELIWRKRMDDHGVATLTAASTLVDDVLYVPISSLEEGAAISADYPCCTFRGAVAALNAGTGEELWRRYFIPPAKEQATNGAGKKLYGPSGVPVWAGMSVDGDLLFVATGDDYTGEGSGVSDSVIALNRHNGEIVWVAQARAGDVWNASCEYAGKINCPDDNGPDWDYGAGPVVATGASGRKLLLAGDKGGLVVGLDPLTGKVLWRNKVGRGGVVAGINFGLAAHGGKVFVPVSDVPDGRTYDEPAKPGLYALDIDTGEFIWKAPAEDTCNGRAGCFPGYSAAITVLDDYVLAGSNDGYLRAFDTENGAILWEYDTTRSVGAVGDRVAQGGSVGGGQAPIVVGDRIILNSGYAFSGKMPGNALLVLKARPQ